jgi:selenocysteine-specific elongation factor
MIIALAGHVDHGKTALIQALTGINTDRLPQEQARGLTIDLGFAYQPRDTGPALGFVDVPGHERFVHNMVAGINRSQVALLVVAADDGVMPQTQEHLAIMTLLGIERGVIAINKVDRVESARIDAVEAQIRELCQGSFLAEACCHRVSALTGAGVPALRDALETLSAAHADPQTNKDVHARFAVDRAFSLKGVGTVATGMLVAGELAIDDELRLFPGGQSVRVRSLRANDHKAKRAGVGDRIAVNLSGIERSQIQRGHWLHGGTGAGTQNVHITLQRRPGYRGKLKAWQRVHVYHGTTHVEARLALIDVEGLENEGQSVLAELLCDAPLLAAHGDRLILREHGLDDTIGGGTVLSVSRSELKRRSAAHIDWLGHRAQARHAAQALATELSSSVVNLTRLAQDFDLAATAVDALAQDGELHRLPAGLAVAKARWAAALAQAQGIVKHLGSSQATGRISAAELCPDASAPLRAAVLQYLVADGALQRSGDQFQLAQTATVLAPAEAALLDKLKPGLAIMPPPSLGDLGKEIGLPADQLRRQIGPLVTKGALLRFGDNRLLLPDQFKQLAELARRLSEDSGPFTVRAFRDASGLGRNLAIDVLEHMDSGGYTRRQENVRHVVGDLSRLLRG